MAPIETQRLLIRELTLDDAAFILELLNEPAFHRYIGDKGVSSNCSNRRRWTANAPPTGYAWEERGTWLPVGDQPTLETHRGADQAERSSSRSR